MTLPIETLQDNGEELITLTRMLRRSRGKFALAFARCNSPAGRQVLVERLRVALDAAEIPFQEVTLNTTENIIEQLQGVPGENEGQPVFIYGIEFLLPSDRDHHATLSQLNERREKFQKLARPLIFWLPEFALQEIATKASDFWAWRSGVYRFEVEAEMRVEDYRVAVGEALWKDANLSKEEKNARLSLLLGLAQDYSEDDPTSLEARARIYHRIGFLRASLGDLDDAMLYYQKSLEISESLNDLKGKATILHAMASIFNIHGNLEHAIELYQASLEINETLGNLRNKATILNNMGHILVISGDFNDAMQCYQEALEINEKLGNLQGKSSVLHAMAGVFVIRNELKHATELYQEALEISENLGDLIGKSASLNNIANLLFGQGKLEQAEELFQQCLEIAMKLGNPKDKATSLHNLANIYRERGDLERAMQFNRESLELKESIGDMQGKASSLHAMAVIFTQQGELEHAKDLYKEVLGIRENLGDSQGKVDALAMLAQVEALQGHYKEALSKLISAGEIALQIGAVMKTKAYQKNIAMLKSITGPDTFSALWTEVTGEETLPEWLQETK